MLAGANLALGAVTSDDHPTLKKALQQHPDADSDQDGVLSYAEYRALLEKHPPKQEDGRPAGLLSTVLPNGDLVIAQFEENNLPRMREFGWSIEGAAFARDLTSGTQAMKRRAGSPHGKYLLTSYVASDDAVGEMTSPTFEIEQSHIEVVMSGGEHPQKICVALLVDDAVVRTATGRSDDLLEPVAFDVAPFKGRRGRVRIIDSHSGLWGHINVDRIYQTNQPRADRVISDAPVGFGQTIAALQLRDGRRQSGPLSIKDGALLMNNNAIALDAILLAVCDNTASSPVEGGAVTLTSGEVWRAKIVGFAKDKVTIQSTLFAERIAPASQIASLDFLPGAPDAGQPGTLYRTQGEPIPGKLVWVRDKDIAIDCPLGIVPLPREIVQRFVMASVDPKAPRAPDEIGLTDGSLFRGTLAITGDKFVLTHPTLGELSFAAEQTRYIQRTPDGVSWFDRLESSNLEQIGPVLPPPAPRVVEISGGRHEQIHLRNVRMLPHTVARYALPERDNGNTLFRAHLSPVAGSRADVVVKIMADGRIVREERLAAGGDPVAITADLGAARQMTIDVNYGEQLAFPCGVDWLDAHLLTTRN